MRVWLARGLAVVALAAAVGALLAVVKSVGDASEDLTEARSEEMMLQLARANAELGDRLNALEFGASPREAQEAVRSAVGLTGELTEEADGDDDLSNRLRTVFRAEFDYLDAVGSTLANPRSALRGRIGDLAQTLRDALRQVPGGDHRAVRGGQNLIVYSEARAGDV